MRFSTVLALTLATASAAPALASFAEVDARDVDVELLSRAYLGSDGKVHYAPGVRGGGHGTGSRPKGLGSRPRELYGREVSEELYSRAYLDNDGKVRWAPGVRNGHRGTGSRRKGAGDGSTPSTNQPRPHHGPKPSSSEKKTRELETEELFSRAYIGADGKVHHAPGTLGGGHGAGARPPKGYGARPRDLDGVEELFSRAYLGSDGKVHYAPGVRGGGRGTGSRPKGTGSRPRELQERAYIGTDGKVHYAPGVRPGGRGTGSRPKGTGSTPRELLDREFFYDSLDLD